MGFISRNEEQQQLLIVYHRLALRPGMYSTWTIKINCIQYIRLIYTKIMYQLNSYDSFAALNILLVELSL